MKKTKVPISLEISRPVGEQPSHGQRQHHHQHAQTFGKNRARSSGDILADRQAHTQTGEVIMATPKVANTTDTDTDTDTLLKIMQQTCTKIMQ